MRSDEPRVTVRLSAVDHAMLSAAAEAAGVSLGSLLREGGMRFARELAESSAPAPKMRRRSAAQPPPAPVPSPAAPRALPPGVTTARNLMMDRQRKLNERRP